jgi:hypothetical protein
MKPNLTTSLLDKPLGVEPPGPQEILIALKE